MPSDKLVAISGIASEYAKLLAGDTYIAGVWKDTLPFGLLWGREGWAEDARPRPPAYRAPSWSWASVDCPVQFESDALPRSDRHAMSEPSDGHPLQTKVLDIKVRHAGPEAFGRLIEASITISGRWFSILPTSETGATTTPDINDRLPNWIKLKRYRNFMVLVGEGDYKRANLSCELDDNYDPSVFVGSQNYGMNGLLRVHSHYCLILRKVLDSNPPTYRRIGKAGGGSSNGPYFRSAKDFVDAEERTVTII